MEMKPLIKSIITEYKNALKMDPENTDFVMFELEEVANKEGMSEADFLTLSELVYAELEKGGK